MECRVEHCDLGVVGPEPARDLDAFDVRRIVQWGQRNQLAQRLDHGCVDDDGRRKQRAAVNAPVTNGIDPVVVECFDHSVERSVHVGHRLDGPASDPIAAHEIDELVLHRRRAGIESEHSFDRTTHVRTLAAAT